MSDVGMVSAGGSGTIKFSFYKRGGKYQKRGLRNKRKSYWAGVRKKELMAKLRQERLAEEREDRWNEEIGAGDYQY